MRKFAGVQVKRVILSDPCLGKCLVTITTNSLKYVTEHDIIYIYIYVSYYIIIEQNTTTYII